MKIIVCHPAQQHSYRLATALKRAGMLSAYITTVYYKKGSLTVFVSKMLKGKFQKKAMGRCCSELSDSDVIQFCEGEGLLKLLALNVPQFRPFYYKLKYNTADRFARKVAKYAIKSKADVVITYDDCSPLLFEILKEKAPNVIRILDMSAANLHYMRQIYDKDTELMPEFANRLHQEYAKVWNDEIMEKCLREIRASQYFLTPSSFVRKSLRYSGVEESQMLDCPYGVDISEFFSKMYTKTTDKRPMKFVYVGGVKELKGISYLLEAFMEIPKEQAELTVVGNFNPDDSDIKKYLDRINFTGMVLHSDVAHILRSSDVFVFPSLGDSYALSVMEAASCGLPVIVSENTGVSDKITDGVEGFVVPIQSKETLKDKINYFISNPEKIETMGKAARRMAEANSWNAYYDNIASVMNEMGGGKELNTSQINCPVQFIYVGGVKELKGISYLLEAFMKIPQEQAKLTVVGNFNPNDTDIKKYLERVRFTGMVLHSEISDLLRASDVFVFPSLGEGLSLSTLEAAACGLPLIVSENSGVNDYIKEGEEGFVIPIQSVDSIVEKVDWFCKHRDKIEKMGNKARQMAVQFTWDKYYEQAVRSIEEVVSNERKSDSAGGQHNARIRQQKN